MFAFVICQSEIKFTLVAKLCLTCNPRNKLLAHIFKSLTGWPLGAFYREVAWTLEYVNATVNSTLVQVMDWCHQTIFKHYFWLAINSAITQSEVMLKNAEQFSHNITSVSSKLWWLYRSFVFNKIYELIIYKKWQFDKICGILQQWCVIFVLLNFLPAVNTLVPGMFEWNFRKVIFKITLLIDDRLCYCPLWMRLGITGDKLTLFQVMVLSGTKSLPEPMLAKV